jgi:hypothetical protein
MEKMIDEFGWAAHLAFFLTSILVIALGSVPD